MVIWPVKERLESDLMHFCKMEEMDKHKQLKKNLKLFSFPQSF